MSCEILWNTCKWRCVGWTVLFLIWRIGNAQEFTPCSKLCNGQGKCRSTYGVCECFNGFTGADCSLHVCPFGKAWVDIATADEVAHGLAECSNRGMCNRLIGRCECENGFEGERCERKACPNNCSLKGRCVSSNALAAKQDPGILIKDIGCTAEAICQDENCDNRDYTKCKNTFEYATPWDSPMMHGCICDKGYSSYDCSRRLCQTGDDPLTGMLENIQVQRNEVQLLECQATFGTFTLAFKGETTTTISVDASVSEFTAAIQALKTINDAGESPQIAVEWLSSSATVCTGTGNDIQITFLQHFGDLPLIIPDGSNLGHITASQRPIITSQKVIKGDKESDVCSNRGTCSENTGVCSCLESWMTSDGYFGSGTRGDCGHLYVGTTSTCPGEPACLGYGTCSGPPEFRCECQKGRTGPDCALMTCPQGKAWFSFPSEDNRAHGHSECSDMGQCNRSTGTCDCAWGFSGAACQHIKCPGLPVPCHGNGECLSMETLANSGKVNGNPVQYSYGRNPNDPLAWDFDQMQGCLCSQGWEGYDCSLKSCPRGDDPQTPHQFNEVQHISCDSSTGTFAVTFRGEKTVAIKFDDTINAFEAALNDLSSIAAVKVAYTDSNIFIGATNLAHDALQLCRATNQVVLVEFLSPTGDIPLMTVAKSYEMDGTITISEVMKGTKEHITCSGRGLCDHITGLCKCFTGFASSDGQNNAGLMGDCGFKSPVSLPIVYPN